MGDARFGPIHDKTADQQHRGNDQTKSLIQMGSGIAHQVEAGHQKTAKNKGVWDDEQPQT